MAKPSGADCNLDCRYCFYTEKENLYGGRGKFRMSPKVLDAFIKQYIAAQSTPDIQFAWQGGEPTLMGIDFFKNVLSLQQKYAGANRIFNTLQTNGFLLDDPWAEFLAKNNFLVGISVDGPEKLHNHYRVNGNGKPTFDQVMAGVQTLKKHGVPFNTLTVINDKNSKFPINVYRFLKEIGDGHMQFIPAVERVPGNLAKNLGLALAIPPSPRSAGDSLQLTPWSVSPGYLSKFYLDIFAEWVRHDVGKFFVQFFDVTLGNWLNAGGLCHFAPQCGQAGALEHNGDLYSCDHYVYPQHKLGNIMETPLSELMQGTQQREFGTSKWKTISKDCKSCTVHFACHGDCIKHRFAQSSDGETNLSYLCPAYKKIFTKMAPYMEAMAQLVRSGQPVPDIMKMARQHDR